MRARIRLLKEGLRENLFPPRAGLGVHDRVEEGFEVRVEVLRDVDDLLPWWRERMGHRRRIHLSGHAGKPSLGASRTDELEPGPGWQIPSGFPAAEGLPSYIPGAGLGRSLCARKRQRRRRRARPPRLSDCPINKVCSKLPPLGKRRAESGAVELCMTSWPEPACPTPLLFLLLPPWTGWRGWAGHFAAPERRCPRPAAPRRADLSRRELYLHSFEFTTDLGRDQRENGSSLLNQGVMDKNQIGE